MQQFLMLRRDDLLHLGIQWSDFQLKYENTPQGNRPLLVANSNAARVTLTFPPQVIEEQVWKPGVWSPSASTSIPKKRSGTSRVQFAVPSETPMELSVEGVLKVLNDPKVHMVSSSEEDSTAIELPWKLIVSAIASSRNGIVLSNHPVLPATSTKGVTELWYARLMANDGDNEDAALSLFPLRYIPRDEIDELYPSAFTPLAESARKNIVERSTFKLPYAKRLELSSLGGSLTASGKWSDFEWDHQVVLGRDQKVRTLVTGVLCPFGHKARVELFVERDFLNMENSYGTETGLISHIPDAAGANTISRKRLLVTEPIIKAVKDARLAREFPFDEIEILTHSFDIDVTPMGDYFTPHVNGKPLQFPIRLAGTNGDVFINVPLIFVMGDLSTQFNSAKNEWKDKGYSTIDLPGVPIDMIRDNSRAEGVNDIYEVHKLSLDVNLLNDGSLCPKLEQFTVELPALRELQPHKLSVPVPLKFTDKFKELGASEDMALELINNIDINFTDRPDCSGGLMAPKFSANKISRTRGPVPHYDNVMPLSEIYKGATLLGLPLEFLIDESTQLKSPKIIQVPGNPLGAKMEWPEINLKSYGPFKATSLTKATLQVDRLEIMCKMENFEFELPLKLVKLKFGSLKFTQKPNYAPNLEIDGLGIEFCGELKLLKKLLDDAMPLLGGNKPSINATTSGITASYTLGLPKIDAGMFILRNVAIHCGINVPFSPYPVTMSLGFGRRDNPFNLSVMMFGGGGYIDVQFGGKGLTRLEACMEFGAMVAVNFLVASAEVHALGGVRFLTSGETIELDAFIRIGGSVEILGLVSVSVELTVKLGYNESRNSLYGRATLVIEVDLTLFSESITIDSGNWELIGSDIRSRRNSVPLSPEDIDLKLMNLMKYYEAFEQI